MTKTMITKRKKKTTKMMITTIADVCAVNVVGLVQFFPRMLVRFVDQNGAINLKSALYSRMDRRLLLLRHILVCRLLLRPHNMSRI